MDTRLINFAGKELIFKPYDYKTKGDIRVMLAVDVYPVGGTLESLDGELVGALYLAKAHVDQYNHIPMPKYERVLVTELRIGDRFLTTDGRIDVLQAFDVQGVVLSGVNFAHVYLDGYATDYLVLGREDRVTIFKRDVA